MRDILLNESIHLDKNDGIHLLSQCSDQPNIQTFVLELLNCHLFEYSKCFDGDLLTIHFSPKELDHLCSAYLKYRKQQLDNSEFET
ncbi:MAG: hypothetical protein CL589_13360 [Alteromonadaceae bacterium]|nr:hypothetical protein [Alteromonadaceae bacterium]MAX43601.1 hypothetical protein [Alteromonadaceae bacterium]